MKKQKQLTYTQQLNEYIDNILNENILSGQLFKLSVKRYLNDISSDKYELNTYIFERCCNFISNFKHNVGSARGQNFKLEGWELFIIANIVSLYEKDTNKRKYNQSYIQIARKNGKTFLVSALSLYYLIYDNEYSAEIVLSANTFQQSQLMYDVCQHLMNQLDPKLKFHSWHRGKDIIFKPTNSKLHTISTKSRGLDGFNVSFAAIDEYHAAADASVKNVLISSIGMRENPHLCVITTAGFNLESVCYQLRNDCIDVLKQLSTDNATFSAIFELDTDDDLNDERVWVKSNPNIDVTVKRSWLREQVNTMQSFKSEEVNILTKNFNMWCNAETSWIDEKYLIFKEIPSFNPDEVLAYVGVDLSSVSDLTAVNYLIIHNDTYYFDTHYYLPNQFKSISNYNTVKFRQWADEQHITLTSGNVTDYDYILSDILQYKYQIKAVYYDSYNATQFAINATSQGINMIPYSQSISSFNRPCKELERIILAGKAVFNKNPLNLYCFRNVQLKTDYNANVKPDKSHSTKKIDGVIAQIQSLAGYLIDPIIPSIM